MRKIALLLFVTFLIGTQALNAQVRLVSGTVTGSEDGAPIPGVSVVVKGTMLGTVTNFDGNFSLQVPQNANTLIFSSVGFGTQEVVIDGRTAINIVLNTAVVTMDEFVVVAYGTAKKESLTGAVSNVGSEVIEKRPVSNVAGVLEGKAAGVQVNNTYGEPGADPVLRIRGFGSVNGINAPL